MREYPVGKVCSVLEVSRSAYYYKLKHPSKAEIAEETECVVKMFYKHFGNFGRRTLHRELAKEEVYISERKISKILKEQELRSKYGKRKGKNVHTSQTTSKEYIAENLYPKLSEEDRRRDILSIDFTEEKISGKKVYTCGIINVNTKVLEAKKVNCKNNSESACEVIEQAIKKYGVPYMILSDRGSSFVSKSLRELLQKYGIKHSMSRPHTPADNCFIETFWKTFKTEIGNVKNLTIEQYKTIVEYYVHYYNCERPHSSLNYRAPLANS